jgi:hypothetical protein
MGKWGGGFYADVWINLLLDVIGIAMIPVNYEPMEGILIFVAGPCPTDRYIWVDD